MHWKGGLRTVVRIKIMLRKSRSIQMFEMRTATTVMAT